jgi:hypothetical protein
MRPRSPCHRIRAADRLTQAARDGKKMLKAVGHSGMIEKPERRRVPLLFVRMMNRKTQEAMPMAGNDARRQQKVMKKRRKDKLRKKKQADFEAVATVSARKRILLARDYPLHECLINPSWRDKGMATILVSRRQNNGDLVFGVFLVDVLCLGLKNTFCNGNFSAYRYKEELIAKTFSESPAPCPPALAHQIVYGSIAYARQFGFEPQRDFALSQYILDPPGRWEPWEDIEFGRDGKPLYIAGPHDNPQRILRKLEATAGAGSYDYIVEEGAL